VEFVVIYSTVYGFDLTGEIISGPRQGTKLENQRQENMDVDSLESAIRKAESYRGKFVGTVSIYSRQYSDKLRGFIVTENLAVVVLN
jgi:hypothetical protein